MTKYCSETENLSGKRLQDLLDEVGTLLHEKKTRQLLESEIVRCTKEIKYIEYKVAVARRQLQETMEATEKIEPGLSEARKKHACLQKERETTESEYAKLKEVARDVERKLEILPKMREKVAKMRQGVREAETKVNGLRRSRQETLTRRKRLEAEIGTLKEELSGLETEIPVMKSTRDILVGLMPADFSADAFEDIQDELEKSVANYVDERKEEIEKIEEEATALSAQLDEKHKEERSLLSAKEELQRKIEDLVAEVGSELDKSVLVAEVNKLQGQKEHFVNESATRMQELDRLDSTIRSVDNALEEEKKGGDVLSDRHAYLVSRKQEIEGIDNLAAELERLENEIQELTVESEASNKLLGIISDIKQDVDSMNGKLRSALEDYNKLFTQFDKTITGLLS